MPHAEEVTVPALLNFHSPDAWPAGKPREIHLGTAGDKLRKHEPHLVQITDLRTSPQDYTLDANGFQFVSRQTSLSGAEFQDDDLVKDTYYPEVESLLRSATGASRVKIMSHLVRRSTFQDVVKEAEELSAKEGLGAYIQKLHPAMSCHVDQSFLGSRQTLEHAYPQDAEVLARHRWGIVNVWRPVKLVERDPLAVCDWRSVDPDSDLIGIDIAFPAKGEHTAYGRIYADQEERRRNVQRWVSDSYR